VETIYGVLYLLKIICVNSFKPVGEINRRIVAGKVTTPSRGAMGIVPEI